MEDRFRFKRLLTALGVRERGGPERARALALEGIAHLEAGRRRKAIEATERAAALYRELAGASPAFLAELAATLANLSGFHNDPAGAVKDSPLARRR